MNTGVYVIGKRVRRATVRQEAGRIEIVSLDEQLLPDSAFPSFDSVAGRDAWPVSTAERKAMSNGAFATLPACDVITRTWDFPRTDSSRLRQMVAHRLEADLPIPLDQLAWGYLVSESETTDDPTTSVRMQAARHDRILQHMKLLEIAGVHVDTVTTEADALAALARLGLREKLDDGIQVLVLAADDVWIVSVFIDGEVCGLRHVQVEPGQLATACQECRQMIESHGTLPRLKRVFWAGAEHLAPGRDLLAERLGVSVDLAKVAGNVTRPMAEPLDCCDVASYGPAIGLALAGLLDRDHLVRLGGAEREQLEPHGRLMAWISNHPIRWVVTAVGLATLALLIHVWSLSSENRRMEEWLAQYDPGDSPMVALEPKIRAMGRLSSYRVDVETIVAHLCAKIPNGITLTSIEVSRERGVAIKGSAGDLKDLFKWTDDLRQSHLFANVEPGRTEPGRGGAFTLTAEVVGIQDFSTIRGRGHR